MKRRDFLTRGVAAGTVSIFTPATGQTQQFQFHQYIRWRFCAGRPRLRRDAHGLIAQNATHPVLQSYATAIKKMRNLPLSDPTSLAYQAGIHGYNFNGPSPPAGAPFGTCNHGMGFLVWHRMYLYFYEKIIQKHSGDASFALPYWNYSKAGQANIPAAFRTQTGAFATLFDNTRSAALNAGGNLSGSAVGTGALGSPTYFGFQSSVNGTPHGAVHVAVGGNMLGFATTGFDPLFWLHHCNIDRLWEAWLAQGTGQVNPINDTSWMNQTWTFADENGSLVSMSASDALDTVSQLRYQYEEPQECIPLLLVHVDFDRLRHPWRPYLIIDLVRDLKLPPRGERMPFSEVSTPIHSRIRPYLERRLEQETEVEIVFEGLRTSQPMRGYFEIYGALSNVEEGIEAREPVYLGNLNTFGTDPVSITSMQRGGLSREEMRASMAQRISIGDRLPKLFSSFEGDRARLELSFRAVTGVEGEREDIGRLNQEVEVSVEEVRLEFLRPKG